MAEGGTVLPEGTIKCGCCSKNHVFTHLCDKCKEICKRCADIHEELEQGILAKHDVMPIDTKSIHYYRTCREQPGVRTRVEVDEDQKPIKSTVITQTRVCSWNVNNDKSNEAEARKAVNMATFKVSQMPDGTYLEESDIFCLQELTVDPASVTKAGKYLPFVGESYGVVKSSECKKYNAIYYNTSKFEHYMYEECCLDLAYGLCEEKHKYCCNGCHNLQHPTLVTRLVSKECSEMKCGLDKIKERYPHHVKEALNSRTALCVLKDKFTGHYIVALSVHNYHTSVCEKERCNYAVLLLDFLSNIQHCDTDLTRTGYTVVISGDFNFNILKHDDPCLQWYLKQYDIPPYELRPLRQHDGKIDFILVSKPNQGSKFSTLVDGEVKAYDLVPEDHQKQAKLNHNPLSVSIKFHTPIVVS